VLERVIRYHTRYILSMNNPAGPSDLEPFIYMVVRYELADSSKDFAEIQLHSPSSQTVEKCHVHGKGRNSKIQKVCELSTFARFLGARFLTLRKALGAIDLTKSGRIACFELQAWLCHNVYPGNPRMLLHDLDSHGRGTVDMDDFLPLTEHFIIEGLRQGRPPGIISATIGLLLSRHKSFDLMSRTLSAYRNLVSASCGVASFLFEKDHFKEQGKPVYTCSHSKLASISHRLDLSPYRRSVGSTDKRTSLQLATVGRRAKHMLYGRAETRRSHMRFSSSSSSNRSQSPLQNKKFRLDCRDLSPGNLSARGSFFHFRNARHVTSAMPPPRCTSALQPDNMKFGRAADPSSSDTMSETKFCDQQACSDSSPCSFNRDTPDLSSKSTPREHLCTPEVGVLTKHGSGFRQVACTWTSTGADGALLCATASRPHENDSVQIPATSETGTKKDSFELPRYPTALNPATVQLHSNIENVSNRFPELGRDRQSLPRSLSAPATMSGIIGSVCGKYPSNQATQHNDTDMPVPGLHHCASKWEFHSTEPMQSSMVTAPTERLAHAHVGLNGSMLPSASKGVYDFPTEIAYKVHRDFMTMQPVVSTKILGDYCSMVPSTTMAKVMQTGLDVVCVPTGRPICEVTSGPRLRATSVRARGGSSSQAGAWVELPEQAQSTICCKRSPSPLAYSLPLPH